MGTRVQPSNYQDVCRRGVFGCHAALVLRRLQRICQREYRREPRFIVASATIANPQEHIQQLLGGPLGSTHPALDLVETVHHVCPFQGPAMLRSPFVRQILAIMGVALFCRCVECACGVGGWVAARAEELCAVESTAGGAAGQARPGAG